MLEYFKKVYGHVSDFINGLTPARKMAFLVIGSIITVAMAGLFFLAGGKTYQPLLTNLNPEDSTNIIRILRDERIPFTVDPTGKNIAIPPESVYDLRLKLAMMGLPQTSVVGYEVFDKQSLGTTSFVQKINEKRAKEGELMRTIGSIKGVKRSRVHLAIPQKTAFVEDQKKSSASVVLDLEPGTVLTEKQVYGIGNLVARAVEGMEISDVVIVDSFGKVLSSNPRDPFAAETATQLEYKQKVESDLEKRIEAMLGKVVGDGRVVARVNADLDFSQVQETQTSYDGDAAATASVERDVKSMEGSRPGPYGLAGAASNTPGQPPAPNAQVRNDTKTNREIINYRVPQVVKSTRKSLGEPKRLSVAVMVDGKTVKGAAGKDGTRAPASVEAWSPEKLKEFEGLVANVVGLDRKRGDTIEVKSIEFSREDFEEADRILADNEKKIYFQKMLMYTVIGITIALFFLFVVRPFIRWVTENTIDSVETFLPQTIEELEKMQKNSSLPNLEDNIPVMPEKIDPEKVEGEMIKEKIISLVDANPHKAALILKEWVIRESNKKKAEAAGSAPGKGKSA